MAPMADQAKQPVPHKDMLLWVLYLIGACCLLEVSPAWARIAADCAFLPAGPVPTDWTLPVIIEAYWGAALYGWLHDPAGQRSRRFAAGSAVVVFALSLSGQVAVHLYLAAHGTIPPPALTAFAASLPVLVLGCGAMLVHMRRADRSRAEAAAAAEDRARAEAESEAAEADERTALREQLETMQATLAPLTAGLAEATARAEEAEAARAGLEPERAARVAAEAQLAEAVSARETAERERLEALTRSEAIAQKLAAVSGRKARTPGAKSAQRASWESAQGDDVTTELRALMELRADPELWKPRMGGELARRIGASPATGRRLHTRYIIGGRLVEAPPERSPDDADERSDERS